MTRRVLAAVVGAALGLSLAAGPTASVPAAAGATAAGATTAGATTAPDTWVIRHPGKRTTSRRAIFEYTSDQGHGQAEFECRLDRRRWRPCWQEAKYRRLDLGRHLFRVRATAHGVTDPTPARFRWQVVEGAARLQLSVTTATWVL